jgi:hypothetical protein
MISEEDTDKYLAEVLEILKERFEGGDKSGYLAGQSRRAHTWRSRSEMRNCGLSS